jgi:hypothetical protein
MRNSTVGLSPNLAVSVPVKDASGALVLDAQGNRVMEKEAVTDAIQHKAHNTQS